MECVGSAEVLKITFTAQKKQGESKGIQTFQMLMANG